MRRVLAVLLALALLGAAVPATAGAQNGGGFASFLQTGDVDPDGVSLRAHVSSNGTAEWRIAYRIRLDDENATAAFESLREDVEANRSAYGDQFAARMRSTVAAAENATGREMAVRNVSVTAERDPFQDFGVVAYTFTWEGFAGVEGDRLVAGDALAGLFLDAGTDLTVTWPDGYEVRSVDPAADERTDGSVTWEGKRGFGPDQPRLVVAPASPLPVGTLPAALAGLVLLAAVGGVWYRRRGAGLPVAPLGRDGGAASGSTSSGNAGGTGSGGPRDEPGTGGSTTAAAGSGEANLEPTDDGPPEELLSPRERVLRLVEGNGGRLKQARVTDALDWSAARTSQVVGDLRDDGELESFRLGRENVLRLPEAADGNDEGVGTGTGRDPDSDDSDDDDPDGDDSDDDDPDGGDRA
ncbi:helix-turn-helix transcriptional regulator [Halorarum halobium]|uniref:helix-turn-helix transcriptional regulator n=1 Tax=Halorarum halobium TaxID=3075121 RepID=UPI0028ACEF85|nr:hypothetical protein [Halobaculum sp. XH14]